MGDAVGQQGPQVSVGAAAGVAIGEIRRRIEVALNRARPVGIEPLRRSGRQRADTG